MRCKREWDRETERQTVVCWPRSWLQCGQHSVLHLYVSLSPSPQLSIFGVHGNETATKWVLSYHFTKLNNWELVMLSYSFNYCNIPERVKEKKINVRQLWEALIEEEQGEFTTCLLIFDIDIFVLPSIGLGCHVVCLSHSSNLVARTFGVSTRVTCTPGFSVSTEVHFSSSFSPHSGVVCKQSNHFQS